MRDRVWSARHLAANSQPGRAGCAEWIELGSLELRHGISRGLGYVVRADNPPVVLAAKITEDNFSSRAWPTASPWRSGGFGVWRGE